MRRMLLVMAVSALVAAMLVVMAGPASAQESAQEMDMSMMGPMLACAHAGVAHGCVHEDMVMAHILGADVSAME